MNLVLEIEFLTGVCRAAHGPGDDAPDWPPQPDRVFSALTSAWGVRGEFPEERTALEWLEEQPSPAIRASEHSTRTAPDVFVPPNDPKASKSMQAYIKVMPDRRPRQPRRFPTARPDDPRLELIWPVVPNTSVLNSLNALASCVGYVGHSASLARCRFLAAPARESGREPVPARRRVYQGRLRELEEAHRLKPERPAIRSGAPVFQKNAPETESSTEWLVLEAIESMEDVERNKIPDIRASACVCRLVRQTLMAGYRKAGRRDAIPEQVSGHAPDGTPTRNSHLAVAPMAFVGPPHADARVLGFALIPPRGKSLLDIDGLREAFEQVAPYCTENQRRVLKLHGSPLREALYLAPAPDNGSSKRSLLPDPYLKDSTRWASVTPIVLDRHLKRKDDTEIRELVAQACENAGLPRPDPRRIRVGKHSTVKGAPAAQPLAGEPPWARWKMPKSLKTRQLVHAIIDFEQAVSGPVLLGAGRFTGLGLCRSVGH